MFLVDDNFLMVNSFSFRADAVRSALDVLLVCSVMPRFRNSLCDCVISIPGEHKSSPFPIILAAASGEIVMDVDCQRSALNIIINCVCGPITPSNQNSNQSRSSKKKSKPGSEELLSKLWNAVRLNNGIMVLLNLLMAKTPITDADSIRTLSCKALCGLARSETVRQVIAKLPLFTNGELQGKKV